MRKEKEYVPWRSSNGKTIVECLESKDVTALKEFSNRTPKVEIVSCSFWFEVDIDGKPVKFHKDPVRFWNKDDAQDFVDIQMMMVASFKKMEV